MRERGEQAQTLDYRSLECLIPGSFRNSVLICLKLLSLGPVCPKTLSRMDVSQLVPLGLGTRIHPLSFLYLTKEGRGQSVKRIKASTKKKSPEQKTFKEFSVSALQCEGI